MAKNISRVFTLGYYGLMPPKLKKERHWCKYISTCMITSSANFNQGICSPLREQSWNNTSTGSHVFKGERFGVAKVHFSFHHLIISLAANKR